MSYRFLSTATWEAALQHLSTINSAFIPECRQHITCVIQCTFCNALRYISVLPSTVIFFSLWWFCLLLIRGKNQYAILLAGCKGGALCFFCFYVRCIPTIWLVTFFSKLLFPSHLDYWLQSFFVQVCCYSPYEDECSLKNITFERKIS